MTVLAMFSDKGSPGVTTTALGLAGVWPRPSVLVEADPAGGDLTLRLIDAAGRPVLAAEPSLLTLAAATRRDPATSMHAHAQRTACGIAVVPGLANPAQARGMAALWPELGPAIRAAEVDVLLDCGRLTPEGPPAGPAARADVLVGVTRAEPAAMLLMRDRMADLLDRLPDAATRRALVVLVAEDRRAREAVEAMRRVLADGAVAAHVAGAVAWDPRAVDGLCRGGARLERSTFLRSVRDLAARLTDTDQAPVPAPRRVLAWSR